jgi:thiol:disulfide interchange protein
MLQVLFFLAAMTAEKPFAFDAASLDRAKALAAQEQKLIIVDVYTDWCGPCKRMDRTTYRNGLVQQVLRKDMVSIKINAEKGKGVAFAKKYDVSGYPCLIVLDNQGNEVARRYGYMTPRAFLDWVGGLL